MSTRERGDTKVVMLNPSPRSGVQAHRRVELPLSVLCPATPLDREGFDVTIVDQFADPAWEEKLERALDEKPICLGVTCMTGPQIVHALAACRRAKERHPDLPIVWGGIHASLLPQQTLAHPLIDVVVVGEGEATFSELVHALRDGKPLDGVNGIHFERDGRHRSTPPRPFVDIDREPPLSYHLLDMDLYRRRLFGVDHISFNSSRGCTFRCSFCWDPVMHRRTWRAMEPETVLDHLSRIVRDHGIRGFLFTDDHFFIDMKRAQAILELLARADLGITISKLQIRADTICRMSNDFLDLLVRARVKRLTVGVESGSQRVLDLIKKDVTVDEVIEANRKLAPYPIVPLYLFMMGLPTETPDELRESLQLADRLVRENPEAAKTFNIYTPYPGTELYGLALQHGLREPDRLEDWARFNFRNIPEESAWIPPATKRLIEDLDFPLMFLGGNFVSPYRKTRSLVVVLGQLYAPIARYRVRAMDVRFPIESRIVKRLGLFARQD
ncbi:MAG TPA: radical SAM protein [Candidatus Binatia bacterium]|nr:radical SAM protein [Candidatus Binatia bacterium]